jgi:molybdenum cofactor cytidylyltransferase
VALPVFKTGRCPRNSGRAGFDSQALPPHATRIVIPAVILAAGQSTRMGRAKALLTVPPENDTFVARLAKVLLDGGAADVLVVGRPDDEGLRSEVDRVAGTIGRTRFVANHHADTGQLSSVIAGLNAADHPGVRAILVIPVDLPLVRQATVAALLGAFSSSSAPIARATCRSRHGHPVIFGRPVFDALRRADPEIGAKAVVRAHPVMDVEVGDPGVLHDIDTPDDYARLLKR